MPTKKSKAEKKTTKGYVKRISTDEKGRTIVTVKEGEGKGEAFVHPDEMTGKQLEEFKRAQNHGHKVEVEWTKKGDAQKVNKVSVIAPDPD